MLRFIALSLLLSACGGNLNPNLAFISKQDRDRIDVILARASVELDRNDLDNAEALAIRAYNRNKNNQTAAFYLSSIYVSKAQLGLIDIAKRLADDLKISGSSNTSSSNTLDILGVLGDAISISDADFAKTGDIKVSDNAFFLDLPVIEPHKPGDHNTDGTVRHEIESLRLLNEAIEVLCPFVDTAATAGSADPRHSCTKATNSSSTANAQVTFSFAMAHLLEAIFFSEVLLYNGKTESSDTATAALEVSNLYKRTAKLDGVSFTTSGAQDIQTYAEAVEELQKNIASILNVTDSESMLAAIMVDFRVAQQALATIEGLPDDMISKIQSAQDKIQEAVDKAGGSSSDITDQTKVLKDQFGKEAVKKLNTAISKYIDDIPLADKTAQNTNITAICNSYESVLDGLLDKSDIPALSQCQ